MQNSHFLCTNILYLINRSPKIRRKGGEESSGWVKSFSWPALLTQNRFHYSSWHASTLQCTTLGADGRTKPHTRTHTSRWHNPLTALSCKKGTNDFLKKKVGSRKKDFFFGSKTGFESKILKHVSYIQTNCYIMRLGEAICVFCSTFWFFTVQEQNIPTTFNHLQLPMHSSKLLWSCRP